MFLLIGIGALSESQFDLVGVIMNDIAFFGVITLILLRMMGLGITINLFLSLKRDRFKIMMLGWLIWVVAGIFPLVAENIENGFLSESLLVANGIAASLGAFLLFLGILFYFTHVSGKLSVLACGLIVVTPILLFLAADYTVAVAFSGLALYLTGFVGFGIAVMKRKTLKELIGKAMTWFYTAIFFSLFWILHVFYMIFFSSDYSYGFYQTTDDLAAMTNYFLGVGMTAAVLILFIDMEYSIAQVEKYQLKDKYSHDLGNILQAVISATSLLALNEGHSQEDLAKRELVLQKCAEASSLVKEIRNL